ncbi:MAG: nucleoside recognition protein [Clostridiales bacterium]|jgi:spore maturation protein A|nr:nucleoside recognition protein [Clostridiales bacterium]
MLNYLWAAMILIGLVVGAITGNLSGMTAAVLDSAGEAVTVALTMLGIMALWTGLLRVGEDAGLIVAISNRMRPILRYLFPGLDANSKAMEYIATNIIANILGLGWAATPSGLKAMEELQRENPHKDTATKEMCMFMIVNMSSLQIVTISVLAFRAQYDSANPSEIIGPGFIATLISTIAAVAYAKFMEKRVFGS